MNRPCDVLALSPDNAISELRLTTRIDSERIERILRLGKPMPLARYAAVMSGFDAFLRAWEPRVQAALPDRLRPWFRSRRRGGFASADLDWLRAVAGVVPVAADATGVASIPLDDLAQTLGSIYVIESSAQASHLVASHLQTTLGLGQGRGASFFHGFGGETGSVWNSFKMMTALEMGESSRATARACHSAHRTLAVLIDLFAPLPPAAASPAPVDAGARDQAAADRVAMLGPTSSSEAETVIVIPGRR